MFQELLAKLAGQLDASNIPYMVIGGQAVLLYGEPRLTRDINITLGIGPDKHADVLALADRLRLQCLVENAEEFASRTLVLPFLEEGSGIRIDLIFSYSPYEQQAIQRAQTIIFDPAKGHPVRFAALEDVIIHKIIAGRPRDIEDIKSILLKNPGYEKRYIESWLGEFDKGLDTRYLSAFQSLERELEI